MASEHEALVQEVAKGLFDRFAPDHMFYTDDDPHYENWRHMARAAILTIAERTKEASEHEHAGHSQDWRDGRRNGIKLAVSWLRDEALKMNDPAAKTVLNNASFHFGVFAKASALYPHGTEGIEEKAK